MLTLELHIGLPPTSQANTSPRRNLDLLKELNRPAEEILEVHQLHRESAHLAVSGVRQTEVLSPRFEVIEQTSAVVKAVHALEKQGTTGGVEVHRPLAPHTLVLFVGGNGLPKLGETGLGTDACIHICEDLVLRWHSGGPGKVTNCQSADTAIA